MLSTKDILFSEQATNFNKTLSTLRKSTLSIKNRLKSILDDSEFVWTVSNAFGLPLVANERCGSWYIPPEQKVGSAYFKSTDGHTGNWSFSSRRLNLQIFDVLAEYDGCVIVDSTRRGKSIPDALSKTVPIWCTVMNKVLFPQNTSFHNLHVPPQVVSNSEREQIEDLIPSFISRLRELNLDFETLRQKINKPLRPIWITRESNLPESPPLYEDFHALVLCTSSRRVRGAEISEGGYIQGAGDDNETWSEGLTPPMFWKHREILLNRTEEEMSDVIKQIMRQELESPSFSDFHNIEKAPMIQIGLLTNIKHLIINESELMISCGPFIENLLQKSRHIHLTCRSGKLGSRDLRNQISKVIPFIENTSINPTHIYVACPDGKDLTIGVSLALLCLYFDEAGAFNKNYRRQKERLVITKILIKQRLAWITSSFPQVNPSRATLQSINDFLFSTESISTIPNKVLSVSTLVGKWTFNRVLVDYKNSYDGDVDGEALFTISLTQSNRLVLIENGYLKQNFIHDEQSNSTKTYRSWIWDFPSESQLRILFSTPEENIYQEVHLQSDDETSKLVGKASHICVNDTYDSEYIFEGADSMIRKFRIKTIVTGPNKNYNTVTHYYRA